MPSKRNRFVRRARDTWNDAEERFADAKDKTEDLIRDHPFAAIAIAAAVGAVAGALTSEIIRVSRKKQEKSIIKKIRKMF